MDTEELYDARCIAYENLGATRSDAQGIVEAQDMRGVIICDTCYMPKDEGMIRCNCK